VAGIKVIVETLFYGFGLTFMGGCKIIKKTPAGPDYCIRANDEDHVQDRDSVLLNLKFAA
jgi:hypothetical protein